MIFYITMGIVGILLSGHSIAKYQQHKDWYFAVFSLIEFAAGLYFLIAAIGLVCR